MINIIVKDLQETIGNPFRLALTCLFSCLVIYLVSIMPTDSPVFKVYIEDNQSAAPNAATLRATVNDIPGFEVVDLERSEEPVWQFIDKNQIHATLLWHPSLLPTDLENAAEPVNGSWYGYVVQHWSPEVARQVEVNLNLAYATSLININCPDLYGCESGEPGEGLDLQPAIGFFPAVADTYASSNATGIDDVNLLYFIRRDGPAPNTSIWIAPYLMIIIASMVGFVFAVAGVSREFSNGTIGSLIIANKSFPALLFLGKAIVPTITGIAVLLVMTVLSITAMPYAVSSGLLPAIGIQTLAVFAAALQGVAVATIVRQEAISAVAAAGYLILLTLFTGIFINLSSLSPFWTQVTALLPPTLAHNAWFGWLSYGTDQTSYSSDIVGLTITVSISLVVALASGFLALRRL